MDNRRKFYRRLVLCGAAVQALLPLSVQAQSLDQLSISVADPGIAANGPKPHGPKPKEKKPPKAAPLRPDRVLRARGGLEPSWGNIRTFWGDNTPFWGNIRTFWGDVSPFEGDLSAFWGNIRTFNDGTTGDAATPLWGNIRTFEGDIGANWGNIRTFWGNIPTTGASPDEYAALAGQLSGLVQQSDTFWGAAVQAQTGKSFNDGFGDAVLSKYGIDLSRPETLANLDANAREHFFIDWYDGLMNFSGADHVDHWMKEVNWSPALTQTLGEGADTTIGLLDFSVTGDETRNIVKFDGISTVANGHGAAVASLLVAAHDGKGVLGIAPKASVVAYNPFDESNTAGWTDIRNGILSLTKAHASIVNLSLGVPHWTLNPDWNGVFSDKAVRGAAKNVVFVAAAGNDGEVQTKSITWNKDNPALIVVGSIDPNGQISSFSNQPGTACLLDGTTCRPDGLLMNRFIVAPGELILVSDGKGGVTRLSGTSFAAPLVSGTIALIHDRWPWLATKPKDTVNIILKSARDLGAPGVDPVYGVGALDVQAALSPFDWNKLTYLVKEGKGYKNHPITELRQTTADTRATWEPQGVYFSFFEDTGESQRDFQVPVSSKLANQTVSVNGSAEQFMGYLTSGFTNWLGAPPTFGPGSGPGPSLTSSVRTVGFANADVTTAALAGFGGGEATLTMAPRRTRIGFQASNVPFQSALNFVSENHRFALQTGSGESAAIIGSQGNFFTASDYDVTTGGANPFVGLATGGAYARVEVAIAERLSVSSAISQHTLRRDLTGLPPEARLAYGGYDPYRASAATMSLRFNASDRLSNSLTYTMFYEGSAVLGMQSRDEGDLPGGSTTDAATFASDFAILPTLTVSGTMTVGRTRAGDPSQANYAVGRAGLVSTAFQAGIGKQHLLDRQDRLRLTFAQPMHVESGRLDVTTIGVVDRQTGDIGAIVQNVPISTAKRRYVAEMAYGRDLMGGIAEVNLFGRAHLATDGDPDLPGLTVGSSFRLAF